MFHWGELVTWPASMQVSRWAKCCPWLAAACLFGRHSPLLQSFYLALKHILLFQLYYTHLLQGDIQSQIWLLRFSDWANIQVICCSHCTIMEPNHWQLLWEKNFPFERGELEDKYQSLVQCTSDPLTAGIMKVSVKDYEAEATRNSPGTYDGTVGTVHHGELWGIKVRVAARICYRIWALGALGRVQERRVLSVSRDILSMSVLTNLRQGYLGQGSGSCPPSPVLAVRGHRWCFGAWLRFLFGVCSDAMMACSCLDPSCFCCGLIWFSYLSRKCLPRLLALTSGGFSLSLSSAGAVPGALGKISSLRGGICPGFRACFRLWNLEAGGWFYNSHWLSLARASLAVEFPLVLIASDLTAFHVPVPTPWILS